MIMNLSVVKNEMILTVENWTSWEIHDLPRDELWFFETMDPEFWYWFQNRYWWIFWVIVGAYWIGIFSLQRHMKNRKPVENLTWILVTYDILVTLFSILGLWRLSTTFFPMFFSDGFHKSLCERYEVSSKDGFWLVAFTWSKVAHLLDTFFAVLKKKPVQFIQMYHHSLVVLIPQYILPYGEPILYYWGLTNLAQHSVTYPFFAFKALKIKLPKLASTIIVGIELVQMLVGLGTGLYTLHVIKNGGYCVRHPTSITIFNFVYASMTVLAVRMALDHYLKSWRMPTTTIPTPDEKLKVS